MSTLFVGDITHIPFMNTSTTGMCVLQTTDEVDIGGNYNSTLGQRQCFVLTVLTLPQTAPERMSNVGHSRAAIGQSEGRYPLTCTSHPPCRTPPNLYPCILNCVPCEPRCRGPRNGWNDSPRDDGIQLGILLRSDNRRPSSNH